MRNLFIAAQLLTLIFQSLGVSAECIKDKKHGTQPASLELSLRAFLNRGCVHFEYLEGLSDYSVEEKIAPGCVKGRPELQMYYAAGNPRMGETAIAEPACHLIIGPDEVTMAPENCTAFAHAFRATAENAVQDLTMKIHTSPPLSFGDQAVNLKALTEFCAP